MPSIDKFGLVCLRFVEQSSSGWSGRGIEAQVVELEEIDCAPSWQGWNQQGFDLISWGAAAQNSLFCRSCSFLCRFTQEIFFYLSCSFFVLLNHTLFPIFVLASSSRLLSCRQHIGYDLCSINLCCSNNNPSCLSQNVHSFAPVTASGSVKFLSQCNFFHFPLIFCVFIT